MGGSAMQATQKQLSEAKIDLAYRDFCAHLLIPLNECRKRSYFLPWKCEHERHVYEKCQYKECVAAPRPRRGVTQPLKIRHPLPSRERTPPRMGRAPVGSPTTRGARPLAVAGVFPLARNDASLTAPSPAPEPGT